MTIGWFIGNFNPNVIHTKDFEVAIKKYRKGESELNHYHKIATEITVIISGKCSFNNKIMNKDDIILIKPHESVKFKAITNVITCVVKFPSVLNDKYEDVNHD